MFALAAFFAVVYVLVRFVKWSWSKMAREILPEWLEARLRERQLRKDIERIEEHYRRKWKANGADPNDDGPRSEACAELE